MDFTFVWERGLLVLPEGVHGATGVWDRGKGTDSDGEAYCEGGKGSREGDLEVVAGLLIDLGGEDDIDDKGGDDKLPDEGRKGVTRRHASHLCTPKERKRKQASSVRNAPNKPGESEAEAEAALALALALPSNTGYPTLHLPHYTIQT
jgi:hypothetical protein